MWIPESHLVVLSQIRCVSSYPAPSCPLPKRQFSHSSTRDMYEDAHCSIGGHSGIWRKLRCPSQRERIRKCGRCTLGDTLQQGEAINQMHYDLFGALALSCFLLSVKVESKMVY